MWQLSLPRNRWPPYQIPRLEPYLWRVVQSSPGPDDKNDELKDDLHLVSRAAQSDPSITDRELVLFEFLDAIEKHSNWRNRRPTPFLSTFEKQDRAQKWAEMLRDKALQGRTSTKVTVYKIDMRKLRPDVRLYRMDWLVKKFGIGDKVYPDEVLFFGRIPQDAVVNVFELGSEELEDADWIDPRGTNWRIRAAAGSEGDVAARNVEENLSPLQIELRKGLGDEQLSGCWYRFCNGKGDHRFQIEGIVAMELGDIGESRDSQLTGPPCLAKPREEQPREEEYVSHVQGASTTSQWVLEFSMEVKRPTTPR